jgi:hypothetical protein
MRKLLWATFGVALISMVFAGCEKDKPKYTVQFVATEGGTIDSQSGEYEKGEYVDFKAIPADGYYFSHWNNGEGFLHNSVSIRNDTIITAFFEPMFTATAAIGNHDYVDLGLESGTLWATCNVGAAKPWNYGDYFAWGETTPKNDTTPESVFSWKNYKYCDGSDSTLTKYCNDSARGKDGYTDRLNSLLPEDDAAIVNWGNGFHTPSTDNWKELSEQCIWDNTGDYAGRGVRGFIIYKAKSNEHKGLYNTYGYRDNGFDDAIKSYSLADTHIFLPETPFIEKEIRGENHQDTTYNKMYYAQYWANSLYKRYNYCTAADYCWVLYSNVLISVSINRRSYALPVRPVWP